MTIKLFQSERMQDLESEVNSFTQGNNSVTDIIVTPVYTTILEESILQGYLATVILSN
jgi:hypothetical protein